MAKELSKLITEKRIEQGMSKRELARTLNLNPNTIISWESGSVEKLRPENAKKLSEALDIPLEDIPVYEREVYTGTITSSSQERQRKTMRRIKTLRLQHNLTQEELANKIGVTKYTICSWETGRTKNIPSACFDLLADVFRVRPTYLSGVDDDPEDVRDIALLMQERPEIAKLFKLAKEAPTSRIKAICRLLEELNGEK